MDNQKRLVLENILNCRDLGGFPTKYGVTKYGKFLRCGVVDTPTDNDIKVLEDYGVKTTIDLRGSFETDSTPSNFDRISGSENHHISLFEQNAATEEMDMSLAEVYITISEEYKANVKKIFSTIANAPDGTILYHCFFGKDRTGVTSMFLLTIAGAYIEDIIADYQVTYTYILPYIKLHEDELWETSDDSFHRSDPETISALILYLEDKYGSILGYLRDCGVTDEEIEKTRKRFYE